VLQENIGLKNQTNRHIEEINELRLKVTCLQAELANIHSQQTINDPAYLEAVQDHSPSR